MALVAKPGEQKHRALMIKLSEGMDPNDVTYKQFIYYLRCHLPDERLTKCQESPIDVITEMERLEIVKVGDYQRLKEAFEESGYKDLLDDLKEAEKSILRETRKRNSSPSTMTCVSSDNEPHKRRLVSAVPGESKQTPVKRKSESDKQIEHENKKRRQETEGLKQLKPAASGGGDDVVVDGYIDDDYDQTEDKLDTDQRLGGYISTKQGEEAKKLLGEKRSIVIKGNPGEGKTTTALHLIDNEIYINRRVVIYCPNDWKAIDTDWVDIVILEDIFGQIDLDSGHLQEWLVYLRTIQDHVDAGKLQVIITTRTDILSKAYSKLTSIKLFSDDLSLTLSSEKLTDSERMHILNRALQRHERNMNENEKEECTSVFYGLIGFPQCCSLFAADGNLFDRGPEFFKSPAKLFLENIAKLENTRFLSLAFCFCSDWIDEDWLYDDKMPKRSKRLLKELAFHFQISKRKASTTLLRDSYKTYRGLYVVMSSGSIRFSHTVVYEVVGYIFAQRCPEMFLKYVKSEYLYQRTYTTKTEDVSSQDVFIPASYYAHLVKRMVDDVVENKLVESVVKHSALKQRKYLMKLKDELRKSKKVRDFFEAKSCLTSEYDLLNGRGCTFLQHVLQSNVIVTLVYNMFLNFLACAHKNNCSRCWLCNEKQNLLELALYYHRFEIADKLIAMNACYTHTSLCNAARYGDRRRLQSIIVTLKTSQLFSPVCDEAKDALCRAYISGNPDVIELFLNEGITLDSKHLIDVVRHGDINALMKVTKHLKCHNDWNPHQDQHPFINNKFPPFSPLFDDPQHYIYPEEESIFSTALYIAYNIRKFEMAHYLVKNGVNVSMDMLFVVSVDSSLQAVSSLIETLIDAGIWVPNCSYADEAIQMAFRREDYDMCSLLIKNGVRLPMDMIDLDYRQQSFQFYKKAVEYLKVTNNWDPKYIYASEILEEAYSDQNYDVCDLLVQEGVSIRMIHLCGVILRPLDFVKTVVHQLKDTNSWDPKSKFASKALTYAYCQEKYDVCDLLIKEGVSLTMMNLVGVIIGFQPSFESVNKAIQHLKDNGSWDPKYNDACEALRKAYVKKGYNRFNRLFREGVELSMRHLSHLIRVDQGPILKVIQDLKNTAIWDPQCDYASEALTHVFIKQQYDVCNLLIQNGVSLTMKHIFEFIFDKKSLECVEKAIRYMKDTAGWNPKCDDAYKAFEKAYKKKMYDICDLLVEEGVSPSMMHLPGVINSTKPSESVKNTIKQLKDSDKWDSKCDYASQALCKAYCEEKYDVCDLLIQEGVLETMTCFPGIIKKAKTAESIKKGIQRIKVNGNWDPECETASKVLCEAYCEEKYEVCDLLIQEGVLETMICFPGVIKKNKTAESIKKAIQRIKETGNWNPKNKIASNGLCEAYCEEKFEVCDALIQERISLTMKHFPCVVFKGKTCDSCRKTIQHLKDTDEWNPVCADATDALGLAYGLLKYDVCDLLIEEGVAITMDHLSGSWIFEGKNSFLKRFHISVESVKKAIQHSIDSKCDNASTSLGEYYSKLSYNEYDLLIRWGSSLSVNYSPETNEFGTTCTFNPDDVYYLLTKEGAHLSSSCRFDGTHIHISVESVKKAIQQLKETNKWDPKDDNASTKEQTGNKKICYPFILQMEMAEQVRKKNASQALESAYHNERYDVCALLIQEGISVSMNYFLRIISTSLTFEFVKKIIQTMRDTVTWDPQFSDASKALKIAYGRQMCVCDPLIQEGVAKTMNKLFQLCNSLASVECIKKVIQQFKDTGEWDSECDDACKACKAFEFVKNIIQNMRDAGTWDPQFPDASKALKIAYGQQLYDVCDLLIQEGVSITMHHLFCLCNSPTSVESVQKAIQHLKDTGKWDPKCDDACKALQEAHRSEKYDLCVLLTQEGVTITMKQFPSLCGFNTSADVVTQAIKFLKNTDEWDPKCDYASEALTEAFSLGMNGVCDLLIQEGITITMKHLADVCGFKTSHEFFKKVNQHLRKPGKCDPRCHAACKAIRKAYGCQEYVSLHIICESSLNNVKQWFSRCGFKAFDFVKKSNTTLEIH